VYKVNGTSGEIIWTLNGKRSDFAMGKGSKFCFQHHARWIKQADEGEEGVEIISLYDNSAHGTEHGSGREVHTAEESSGKILRVDTNKWTAELVKGYYPPEGYKLLSKSQGSTQVLPGGNVLVNWGSEGAVTEYTADGEVVFHAAMDSGDLGVGVENYRAFRFNWTGLPTEEPAVVALEGEEGTAVYVSWNGDTETAVWRFFEVVDGLGSRSFLGEVERKSFETKLVVPGKKIQKVAAEAVDQRGRVLRVTREVGVEPEVLPAKATRPKHAPGTSGVDGQTILGADPSDKSRWEEYAILKVFRLAKDL
jgi:hypothetical protein